MDKPTFVDQDKANTALQQNKIIFKELCEKFRDKPVTQRQCNDICCGIFFFIFFAIFIAYSGYSIRSMTQIVDFNIDASTQGTILQGVSLEQFKIFAIVMFSCLGGGIFVSLIQCGLLCVIPEKGVMILAFASVAPILALGLYFVLLTGREKNFSTFYFIVACGCIGFVLAFKSQLDKAAIIMKTVKVFILSNPKIIILVFICLFYCLFTVCLWCLGFYSFCILYSDNLLSYGGFVGSSIFWSFLLLFFNFYFYYTSGFLVTQSLAIWFYQKEQMDSISTPMRHMIRQIGTITFSSLVVSLVNILKIFLCLARCRTCKFCCCQYLGRCCTYVICCFIGTFQVLAPVLNSYAITISALTGQSFIQSAKIASHIAHLDYQSFSSLTISGYLLRVGTVVLSASIPTLVGAIIIHQNLKNTYLTIIGSLLILFTSSIVAIVCLQLFIQSITALFMMYRLDSEITGQGHQVTWIQQYANQLNKSFDQAFVDHVLKKPKPKYKKVTTIVVHGDGKVEVYKNREIVPQNQQISLNTLK